MSPVRHRGVLRPSGPGVGGKGQLTGSAASSARDPASFMAYRRLVWIETTCSPAFPCISPPFLPHPERCCCRRQAHALPVPSPSARHVRRPEFLHLGHCPSRVPLPVSVVSRGVTRNLLTRVHDARHIEIICNGLTDRSRRLPSARCPRAASVHAAVRSSMLLRSRRVVARWSGFIAVAAQRVFAASLLVACSAGAPALHMRCSDRVAGLRPIATWRNKTKQDH